MLYINVFSASANTEGGYFPVSVLTSDLWLSGYLTTQPTPKNKWLLANKC